jgi:hypothetical protein
MPCYDSRDHGGYPDENSERGLRTEYVSGVNPEPLLNKIGKYKDKVKKLEASLCALITELENRGIANEVISKASKSGLIDLMDFWEKHSKEDEARLAKKFHTFSEHEQEVIRKMIKDGKF